MIKISTRLIGWDEGKRGEKKSDNEQQKPNSFYLLIKFMWQATLLEWEMKVWSNLINFDSTFIIKVDVRDVSNQRLLYRNLFFFIIETRSLKKLQYNFRHDEILFNFWQTSEERLWINSERIFQHSCTLYCVYSCKAVLVLWLSDS